MLSDDREKRRTLNDEIDTLLILDLSGHFNMRAERRCLDEAVAQNERECIGILHAFVEHFCFEYVMRTGYLMKYRLQRKRAVFDRGHWSGIHSLVFHGCKSCLCQ